MILYKIPYTEKVGVFVLSYSILFYLNKKIIIKYNQYKILYIIPYTKGGGGIERMILYFFLVFKNSHFVACRGFMML